jgi:D-alanyl-D-alanine carboxypeptidase (penicillin-binding protein 5/6)
MLTRRLAVLASALAVSVSAFAQQRKPAPAHPPAPHPPSGRSRPKDVVPTGSPADSPLGPVDTGAKWAIALDFATGATLLEKGADEEMPPSSMTKLMTIYLVYERLKQGRLKLDDQLTVSERAWKMGGSKMFVQVGTQVRVEDLIRGVIVQSGNDAAIVLAESLAGSEEQFAESMNAKAKVLGLKHSQFRNCTGWPDAEQHMSVRDIATVARRIILDFPEYYHYDAEKSFKYNNIDQENRNPMVQKGTADGLKTGHTDAGGYGLASSTIRGGRRVVLVLNGMASMKERGEEGERLMDWCFANYENVTLFGAGDTIERASVWLGTSKDVPLVAGRDLTVTMPRNWRDNAAVKVSFDSPVQAPVMKGDVLGKLTLGGKGVPPLNVQLIAGADVPRLGLPGRALAMLHHWTGGG